MRALSRLLQTAHEHPQAWVLSVPRGMEQAERDDTVRAIQDLRPGPLPVIEHAVGAPFDGTHPWVLFVDGQGLLRAAAESRDVQLHTKVHNWSRMFRAR